MPPVDDPLWSRLQLIPGMKAASERLQQRRVLLVGAGSLGALKAAHLAGCHIRNLTLVDGDRVSHNDIAYSPIFHLQHVGHPRVEVIRWRLRAKFPGIDVAVERRSIRQCSPALFQAHDLIVCIPNHNWTRRWVNSWAVKCGKPALFVGVGGWQMAWTGYVFLYQPGVSGCFVCFDAGIEEPEALHAPASRRRPQQHLKKRRAKYGGEQVSEPLRSPVAGAVAVYAAALALKSLAAVVPTPTYSLLDVKQLRLFTREIPPVPSCSICRL